MTVIPSLKDNWAGARDVVFNVWNNSEGRKPDWCKAVVLLKIRSAESNTFKSPCKLSTITLFYSAQMLFRKATIQQLLKNSILKFTCINLAEEKTVSLKDSIVGNG